MNGHTTPYETDTLKGGHRAALDKLERRSRICEPAFGVHPSGPFRVSVSRVFRFLEQAQRARDLGCCDLRKRPPN
jgi:hypothetical protein